MQLQLLLLLLLLSTSGGGFKEMRPLLESFGGDELKSAIGEAEQIAGVMELAKAVMPQASAAEKTSEFNGGQENSGEISPFLEVSSFADPEIIDALIKCVNG